MKPSILIVLVWVVWWPGIVCFKGVCFASLFHYGNKSLTLFVSQEPCQKSAVLVFLRRTVLLGCEHKSSREALSIKANSVSALSNAFCLLCGSLALCSLAVVIIHVPLAYEMLCWFGCFPVVPYALSQPSAEFKCMRWSNLTSCTEPAMEFCAAIPVNPGCIRAWLVLTVKCNRWGQWRSQSRLCRNWGFQKLLSIYSAVLDSPN